MNAIGVPVLAVLALLHPAAYAQVIQFDSVPEPLKLPRDLHFGVVTGVAVNLKRIVKLSQHSWNLRS